MSPCVASVIVTFNPPPGLVQRLRVTLEQTDFIVLVDNASQHPPRLDEFSATERARIHLIQSQLNQGLAQALNTGIEAASSLGAEFALLLDHDSTLQPNAVAALLRAIRTSPGGRPVAAAVPCISYGHPDISCRWPKSDGTRSPLFRFVYASSIVSPVSVDLAIGSGMLVRISTFQRLEGFDASLFIDLVDTDFCLRARGAGFDVVAVPDAAIAHKLGEVEQRHLLGLVPVYPTHHNPQRHYYISRNRIVLARRHGLRFPAWLVYEMLGGAKLTTKVLLFERQRRQKLLSMLRGTRDGLKHVLQQGFREDG